ncbi:metal homeostatis protein bsd2 [Coprinopsis sp. MPI-PUGE-AT-0042]|nr:metal homeostatis protein bsd2 [Coprinopsis sp. MPI-PUGE-AT-0042]
MSNRYVRVANQPDRHSQEIDDEVQAAFDYREDDDDDNDSSESRPLNPNARINWQSTSPPPPIQAPSYHSQGSYNFDSVDYDFPPPGSPPPLSATAFPNEIGNSNGYVPVFDGSSVPPPQQPWYKRATNVLPEGVRDRLGLGPSRPAGPVGGGINNDGVFANVVAKPTRPVRVQNGDEAYVVPEDSQSEAPPSYHQAQADAVPPYWETTVHAPFAPDSMGEMIVDSLPTGSLFSFCWNMLVSISFQFVGFLLTYLLHTSHAARLGSRAGLGVTLIQYGFALRGRLDNADGSNGEQSAWGSDWPTATSSQSSAAPAMPTPMPMGTATDPAGFYGLQPGNNTAFGGMTEEQAAFIADATTEWLSFFLMTIGWFILLTSLLGFYRVKRWEKGILASQQASQSREAPPQPAPSGRMFSNNLEQTFALNGMSRIELLRAGFGLSRNRPTQEASDAAAQAEAGVTMRPLDPNNPADRHAIEVSEQDNRLRENLRAAGFL